jgi:hypothetical protein
MVSFSVFNLYIFFLWCFSFIFDALDECDKDIAAPGGFIDALNSLADSSVKLLFLSRKEEHVRHRLENWPQMEVGGDETTQKDIRSFVSDQLWQLRYQVPHIPLSDKELEQMLLEAAGNMFLYVRLMVQNVIENRGSSPQDLTDILINSPKGLDDMYEQYFLSIYRKNNEKQNRLAARALQLVLYSQAPMTLTMLNMALAINPGDDNLYPDRLHMNMEAVLRQVLGILIEIREGNHHDEFSAARFCLTHQFLLGSFAAPVHQSLKDFLLRLNEPFRSTPPELCNLCDSMDPGSVHAEFTRIFCTLLHSPIARMQLQNCHDLTDRLWEEKWRWVRKVEGMPSDGLVQRELQEESRWLKRRRLHQENQKNT